MVSQIRENFYINQERRQLSEVRECCVNVEGYGRMLRQKERKLKFVKIAIITVAFATV
jgi:hypothetical protein